MYKYFIFLIKLIQIYSHHKSYAYASIVLKFFIIQKATYN